MAGRNAERGAATVAEIEKEGGSARFVAVDMADLKSVRRLADDASEVDILVNNAGTSEFVPSAEQTVTSYDEVFQVNVRAPYFLTAAIAPRMAARGGGSVINVGTMAANIGMPNTSVYGASKAALASLTRTWAAEFAASGVRFNIVAPGPTLTDAVPHEVNHAIGATTLLKRAATSQEIAAAVVFLALPEASYITGAAIPVDGGRTIA